VYCVAIHPKHLEMVVSGGEDDMAYLWNRTNGERIATLEGHTDSVTSAAFNTTGELLATGSMDGRVLVWNGVTGAPIVNVETSDEVIVCIG
jgi:ribosome assembly protein SQT1